MHLGICSLVSMIELTAMILATQSANTELPNILVAMSMF